MKPEPDVEKALLARWAISRTYRMVRCCVNLNLMKIRAIIDECKFQKMVVHSILKRVNFLTGILDKTLNAATYIILIMLKP